MDVREIDKIAGQIRIGKDVVKHVIELGNQVGSLKTVLEEGKDRIEKDTVNWIEKEINYIEERLFHNLTFFIEQSNPRWEIEII